MSVPLIGCGIERYLSYFGSIPAPGAERSILSHFRQPAARSEHGGMPRRYFFWKQYR